MLYLETGSKTQYWFTLRSHFNYIIKALQMPSNRLPFIMANEMLNQKIGWALEWEELCADLNVEPIREYSVSSLKVKLFEILEKVESIDLYNFTADAKASSFHDLYYLLDYVSCPYFNDNFTAHQISVIIKARGGLLNINARAFKENTIGLCTICNLDKPENTFHLLGECPIYANSRYLVFGKKYLAVNEVIDILNGADFSKLYEFLSACLKYRNMLITEFD